MNTLSRSKLTRAVGAFTAVAGALLLGAIVVPADPLGRLVGALIGASVLAGLVGAYAREAMAGRDHARHAAQRRPPLERIASADLVAAPLAADAAGSGFDGNELPGFAPVVSLTEAQVERWRSKRQRHARGAALTSA